MYKVNTKKMSTRGYVEVNVTSPRGVKIFVANGIPAEDTRQIAKQVQQAERLAARYNK